ICEPEGHGDPHLLMGKGARECRADVRAFPGCRAGWSGRTRGRGAGPVDPRCGGGSHVSHARHARGRRAVRRTAHGAGRTCTMDCGLRRTAPVGRSLGGGRRNLAAPHGRRQELVGHPGRGVRVRHPTLPLLSERPHMRYPTSNLMRTSPLLRQGRGQASWKRVVSFAFAIGGAVALAPSGTAHAQWVTVHEQAYYPADHNWSFRKHYRSADRLFNAFDYGHAILYETLWTKPDAPKRLLEEDRYRFLTENLLVNPPSVPLVEDAIEPMYSRLVPEAKAMFEWAHVLHRQLYDVLGDPRLSEAERDSEAR